MQLVWNFDLYVAASTKETTNKASSVAAGEAVGHWSFDATGTILSVNASHPWIPATGKGTPVPADPAAGTVITPTPNQWTPLSGGSAPLITGNQFNWVLHNDDLWG
jgi:hypothetical protein